MERLIETEYSLEDGDLFRVYGESDVYLFREASQDSTGLGSRFMRLILNPEVFNSYSNFRWDDVREIKAIPKGPYGSSTFMWRSNLVRQIGGDNRIYMLFPDGDVGTKRWVNLTDEQFVSDEVRSDFFGIGPPSPQSMWNAIYDINTTEFNTYRSGAPITSVEEFIELFGTQSNT